MDMLNSCFVWLQILLPRMGAQFWQTSELTTGHIYFTDSTLSMIKTRTEKYGLLQASRNHVTPRPPSSRASSQTPLKYPTLLLPANKKVCLESQIWVQILALSPPESWFPHLYNRGSIHTKLIEFLWRILKAFIQRILNISWVSSPVLGTEDTNQFSVS